MVCDDLRRRFRELWDANCLVTAPDSVRDKSTEGLQPSHGINICYGMRHYCCEGLNLFEPFLANFFVFTAPNKYCCHSATHLRMIDHEWGHSEFPWQVEGLTTVQKGLNCIADVTG